MNTLLTERSEVKTIKTFRRTFIDWLDWWAKLGQDALDKGKPEDVRHILNIMVKSMREMKEKMEIASQNK